jgi:microcompartment protein CcmL/EutN
LGKGGVFMDKEALGVIETIGMAAAIEAADSCVKSANVELIGYELTKGSGLVTIKIKGNVGAVKSALEAAKISAAKVSKVYATLIIPRPVEGIERIIESQETVGIKRKDENVEEKIQNNIEKHIKEPIEDDLDKELQGDIREDLQIYIGENQKNSSNEISEDGEENINKSILIDNETLNEQNSEEICNICHDDSCTRRKGQPRSLCIHYEKLRNDSMSTN